MHESELYYHLRAEITQFAFDENSGSKNGREDMELPVIQFLQNPFRFPGLFKLIVGNPFIAQLLVNIDIGNPWKHSTI